jgi:hypothetical protein
MPVSAVDDDGEEEGMREGRRDDDVSERKSASRKRGSPEPRDLHMTLLVLGPITVVRSKSIVADVRCS